MIDSARGLLPNICPKLMINRLPTAIDKPAGKAFLNNVGKNSLLTRLKSNSKLSKKVGIPTKQAFNTVS